MITSYVAVLAGNRKEFNTYIRQGGLEPHEKAVFVSEPTDMYGCEFSRYEVIGTFYDVNRYPGVVLSRVKERLI